MSDSKQQTQEKQRSFTERFFDLEEHAEKTVELMMRYAQSINEIKMQVESLRADLEGLMDSTSAVIELMEGKNLVTKDQIIETILINRSKNIENNLNEAVKSGDLKESDLVKDDNSMVSYRINGKVRFAFQKVGFLEESLRTGLVGKKKGDTVEDVEVLGVYEIPQESVEQGKTNNEGN